MCLLPINGESRERNGLVQGFADPKYAQEMIRSFGALCPSNGTWTHNALSQAQKIIAILDNLRDDPDCLGVATALSLQVDTLGQALEYMEKTRLSERTLAGKRRQQIDILHLLESGEIAAEHRSFLHSTYQTNQLSISLNNARLQYDKNYLQDRHASNIIVNSMSTIFDQMAKNQRCLLKSPQLLSNLSVMGASVSSALITGTAGLGFAAASHTIGYALDFFSKLKFDKLIQKLVAEEYSTAYQCVLESLSNQWCVAKGTYGLIDFKIKGLSSIPSPDNNAGDIFFQGIEIINVDLPVLSSWLNKISFTDLAESPMKSSLQINLILQETMFEIWKINALALLAEDKKKLPKNLTNSEDRNIQFNILQQSIERISNSSVDLGDLVSLVGGDDSDDGGHGVMADKAIFNEIIIFDDLPWALAGIPLKQVPTVKDHLGSTGYVPFFGITSVTFNRYHSLAPYYPLDPDQVRDSIFRFYDKAAHYINNYKNKVLHTDPALIFNEAEDEHATHVEGVRGVSPLHAIDNILNFLKLVRERIKDQNVDTNISYIHSETEEILTQIKQQIQDISQSYGTRLAEIFNLARLDEGDVFINNRIQGIISSAIKNDLSSEYTSAKHLRYKLLSANSVVAELTVSGGSSLTQIKFDIANALNITRNTMQNFAEIFSVGIGATVKRVHREYGNNTVPNQLLGKYCSLLLAVPDWSAKKLRAIDLSLCEGSYLHSEWYGKESSFGIKFAPDSYQTSFGSGRACHFRRFLKREGFYQKYNSRFNVLRQ